MTDARVRRDVEKIEEARPTLTLFWKGVYRYAGARVKHGDGRGVIKLCKSS